jgi:hypothetical protein
MQGPSQEIELHLLRAGGEEQEQEALSDDGQPVEDQEESFSEQYLLRHDDEQKPHGG